MTFHDIPTPLFRHFDRPRGTACPEPSRRGEIFGDYICDHGFAARCRSDSRCRKFPSVPPRMERPAPDRDPGSGRPGTGAARHACPERRRRGLASWLRAPDRGPGRQCWCFSDIDKRTALAVSTGFLSPSEGNPALHSQAYESQIFPARRFGPGRCAGRISPLRGPSLRSGPLRSI